MPNEAVLKRFRPSQSLNPVRAWVLACALGEAIGIGSAAILMHAAQQHRASMPEAAWWLLFATIGMIEGAALGILQVGVLRTRLPRMRASEWIIGTSSVAVLGWLVAAFARFHALGSEPRGPAPSFALMLGVTVTAGAVVGAAFGATQASVLHRYAAHSLAWVWANAAGWSIALPVIWLGAALGESTWPTWSFAAIGVSSGLCAGAVLGYVSSGRVAKLEPWVDEQRWSLLGKVCAVTGANRGIGLEVTKSLARMHARVIVLCRDPQAGERAVLDIRAETPDAEVACVSLDLTDWASVRTAAAEILSRWERLDVLVNNAGAFYATRSCNAAGVEETLAVDAVGPFLLVALLRQRIEAARGRIINLAGIYQRRGTIELDDLHFERRPYDWREVNNQAQLARVAIAAELARRTERLFVASVHPGAVWTRLPPMFAHSALAVFRTLLRPAFVRPELGAMPIVRLAVQPDANLTSGHFFERFKLTTDAPDALLCEFLWQKFEELTRDAPAASTLDAFTRRALRTSIDSPARRPLTGRTES